MSGIRWKTDNKGAITAAVISLQGPNDLQINVSDISRADASKLNREFRRTGTPDSVQSTASNGINALEEWSMRRALNAQLAILNINGQVGDIALVKDSVASPAKATGSFMPSQRSTGSAADVAIGERSVGVVIDGDLPGKALTDASMFVVGVTGLSKDDREKLRIFYDQNPQEHANLLSMAEKISADKRVTEAERQWANDKVEGDLTKAGVASDVTRVGVAPIVPIPTR